MGRVALKGKGRRWAASGHPWVYADDVADVAAEPGALVEVVDPAGGVVGFGLYSAGSRIAVRLVTRSPEMPGRPFWEQRVRTAVAVREQAGLLGPGDACRLLGGDADGIPGLVVDRYARVAVVQCGTQGADRMRDFVLELLREALPFALDAVVDRSDASVRRREGLEPRVEIVSGRVDGPVLVSEGDLQYEVDVLAGHKTGAYLDQRENRVRAARSAAGERVLDAFAYDGLFGIRAALAGAESVLCLEQNRAACERLVENARRNGVLDRVRVERANCMRELRSAEERGERYGVVVLDPPAFARSRREAAGAERGYVELNRRGFGLVRAGGRLVSASCSYNVRPEAFLDFLRSAAAAAGREAWLEELAGAPPDHPQRLALPETRYLKCAFLRVD